MTSKKTKITPRLNFSSSLFTGASFYLNNPEKIAVIAAHPAVSAVWSVNLYPRPSPRIDSVIDVSKFQIKAENLPIKDTYPPHVMTEVDKLHAQGYDGKGVIIAIIDSGIDYK